MADHTLIPPVSGNRQIPKSQSVPAKKDQNKRMPQRRSPEKSPTKNDDDSNPSIDEYA